jgi:hypothetical protein
MESNQEDTEGFRPTSYENQGWKTTRKTPQTIKAVSTRMITECRDNMLAEDCEPDPSLQLYECLNTGVRHVQVKPETDYNMPGG